MTNRAHASKLAKASKLRQQIGRLAAELSAIEKALLRPRRMIAASLIERHLGTTKQKRASSAFYLSFAQDRRTRLVYVPKAEVGRVRELVDAWGEYRKGLRRFRQVALKMLKLLADLGECQARRPGEGKP